MADECRRNPQAADWGGGGRHRVRKRARARLLQCVFHGATVSQKPTVAAIVIVSNVVHQGALDCSNDEIRSGDDDERTTTAAN
jgi:hypothetical protein